MERLPSLRRDESGAPASVWGRIPRIGRVFPRVRLEIPSLYTVGSPWRIWGVVACVVALGGLCLWMGWRCLGSSAGEGSPMGGGDGMGVVTERETGEYGEPFETEGDATDGVDDPSETEETSRGEGSGEDTYGSEGTEVESGASETDGDGTASGEVTSEERVTEEGITEEGTQEAVTSGEAEPVDTEPVETERKPEESEGDGEPAETEADSDTEDTAPDGGVAVESRDVSMTERGAGYVIHTGGRLPAALTETPFSVSVDLPWVLIVNTHPYEGYGDGSAWYDPTSGGLGVTDSPNHPEGVVALGGLLARGLREQGITVIHLRVAVSEEDTAEEIYARTEAAVEACLKKHPEIRLVLDLRRSAEMTEEGEILRTEGSLEGETCAQLRLTVSGGRGEEAVAADLATALYLRRVLWEYEPSVSRPVRIKGGGGLLGGREELRFLTLEAGSAGNTFGEAEALIPLLGRAVAELLLDSQNYG